MSRLDFFSKIENKYNIELSKNRPIILRYDARNTTKNTKINLLDENIGTFSYSLKKTAKQISFKYKCLTYVACDEINIIIYDIDKFLKFFKSNYAQEITSTLAQEISHIFHQYYKKKFILFAGRAFSVYKDNINSYLIYRKHTNVSVLTTYYIKKYGEGNINIYKKSYNDLHNLAINKIKGYKDRNNFQKEGICYYNGLEFCIEDILNSKIEELNTKLNINTTPIIDNDI